MRRALIGHTGFVGGNLAAQGEFEAFYNSKNIAGIEGETFDEVWCAGIASLKWWANSHPDEDRAAIDRLLGSLARVRAGRFVLLSTVDVFREPRGATEETPVSPEGHMPYGAHRAGVEVFVRERFANHLLVRLPNLYGDGLRKNVVFDLLTGHETEKIHSGHVMQWYGLDCLYADVRTALDAGLARVNFAVEPVLLRDLAREALGLDFDNVTAATPVFYDMRTLHAPLFGGCDGYLQDRAACLAGLAAFAARFRGARA